ncbi:MAG: DUF3553 domain-containing protein [Myxococcales bacterium]|nr:DUF3553 domain-containing protein [Myxococcales bacterium]
MLQREQSVTAEKPAPKRRAPRASKAAPNAVAVVVDRFVRHPLRPDWGVGRVLDDSNGQTRLLFSDGRFRKFTDLSSFESVSAEDANAVVWATPQIEEPNAPLPRRRVIVRAER